MSPVGDYSASLTAYFDFGRHAVQRSLYCGGSDITFVMGTNLLGDPISSSFSMAQPKANFVGSGETIAFELMHSGTNQPVGLASLSYELAGIGEDTGSPGP
jgi:hypothetical protein